MFFLNNCKTLIDKRTKIVVNVDITYFNELR